MKLLIAPVPDGVGRTLGAFALVEQLLDALGVPLATIVDVHLKYSKYLSLKSYFAKLQRQPNRNASA